MAIAVVAMAYVGGEPARVVFSGLDASAPLKAGKTSDVVLRFSIVPGFHINSNKPNSELLIPTTLKLDSAGAITAKNIAYEPGKDLAFPFDPDTKLNVYSGEFSIRASLFVPARTAAGTVAMHGELRYQACSDRSCFPPKDLPLEFNVTVAGK